MAQATGNQELVDRFVTFYRNYYRDAISELAQRYPNEQRSLYLDYDDLYQFDADLAEDVRTQPDQMREYAEEALRKYDLPADVKLGRAHVRIRNLRDTIDIRNIRVHDDHIGRLVAVTGIVRKATDVRPRITEAAFECQRCGTMTYIPQTEGSFQEPHECQGCERQGPFRVNHDQSEFVDSQKLRVQESPEGLRGGETPQAIDVNIEDDVTGKVTAGDHVTVTGVLHIEQMSQGNEKSSVFDLYMDGVAVEIEDEEFENMDIDEEDVEEILELSEDPDIYDRMIGSIAPTIYGYEEEKLAMALQLFSGVTKHLPDGSRLRGDLHMLLIGDPGTGKCISGDTPVCLGDGTRQPIRDLVEANLDAPKHVDDGVWDDADFEVLSMTDDGGVERREATKVWKREAPDTMLRVRTASGRELDVTPSHPIFVRAGAGVSPERADTLAEGDVVAVLRRQPNVGSSSSPVTHRDVATDGGTGTTVPATNGISWDRIESIEPLSSEDDWVYDLEVAGTHSYVSNGVVSHNSQLLSYIRNVAPRSVYTSGKGSSAAGLCVTGDTLVHTERGFESIRDLVTEDIPEPVTAETSVDKAVDVRTFDREAGETTVATTSHAWRMPEKPCRRIETRHGKELEASVSTPLLVCGEDGIEWRAIADIEPGDHVATPRYDEADRTSVSVREFLDLTAEKVKLADESIAFLRTSLCEEFGTLRDAAAALDLSEDFIYVHLKNRHVPLAKLDRMLDAVDATRGDVRFDRLMLRHGDSITVPEAFDEDLMYLLGLVFGDGDISLDRRDGNRGMVRLSNGDEALLERAADIFAAKFDKRPEVEYQDDKVPYLRVYSATIARLFANAGMQTPKEDLALAPELTGTKHVDAFLRGLMDADGSVSARDAGGSSVLISTISDDLARQVQLLLETYGVRASVRERDRRGSYELEDGYTIESKHVQYSVEMYGVDIDRYAEAIGFECVEKQQALERIASEPRQRQDPLPVGTALAAVSGTAGEYHNNVHRGDDPGRTRARAMLDDIDLEPVEEDIREAVDADLRWDEVVAAVDTGRKEVFDLTVPGTHNFVGNGIVTHNTAAAVRDDFGDGQQWTLEAGALVLADKGIAAIDELDKMRCVAGDTLVHCGNGRIERIGELARIAAEDGEIEELPNGRTIRGVEMDAWTMDDSGSIVRRPVTAIHEYDAPGSLTRVSLSSGETLTATDDHPFFVMEDGNRVTKPAAELDGDDWVYVPRAIPTATSDGGVAVASAAVTPNGPSPALGAVLGYLSGDGNVYYTRSEGSYGIRFTNAEEELLTDFERSCRLAFDAEPSRPPSEQREDGVETVRLHGKEYADAVLEAGMNLETYGRKSFPNGVTAGSLETKAAFVRALADSEGNVDTATGNVRIASASHELLLGTKELLLEFGVSSQIQIRERTDRRDLHILAITDADSLAAYARHIGFSLERKQAALDEVVDVASGDRTILDVVPGIGDVLRNCRKRLRLYQRECGINSGTYCAFEQEDANVSIHRVRRILEAFETRRRQADADRDSLATAQSWERLETLRNRYHVSYAELAEGMEFRQPQLSRRWGDDEELRTAVRERLHDIVAEVARSDLSTLRKLVRGDVKWRQVESTASVTVGATEDRVPILREEIADLLNCSATNAVAEAQHLLNTEPTTDSWDTLRAELERYCISFQSLASDLEVAGSTVSRWFNGVVETDRFEEVCAAAETRIGDVRRELSRLVSEIESRREPKVYDLTVEGTHNFVANGMVVHNSEDRSAMHQGLEQQEISVSKAGINATLKSRCSLLGAANPKHGRFDQYEPIGEQIDLEPALISRFDLIFTVTDQPDPEEDARLAEHILDTNYAGELRTQRAELSNAEATADEVEAATEEVQPSIEPELFRKYIAYAKRSCYPRMTEDARETIREFYVDMRSRGVDEDSPVPITARKIEALVRLAEASARVRLSDTVEQADAERVVSVVRSSMEDIGVDPETGQFDADVVETGTSKTQRDRIKNLKGLIQDIEDDYEEGAPVEEVLERADEIGLDRSKAEREIESLKKKGEVYEPSLDHLRTT